MGTSSLASRALAARLPEVQDADERARVDAAVARYVARRRAARELAARVVTFDTLQATLTSPKWRPVPDGRSNCRGDLLDVANRLAMPRLRERIAAPPGDQHWRMLAGRAMLDDLVLQRGIAAAALSPLAPGVRGEPRCAWLRANQRAIDRARLLAELRAVPTPDSAMLSVTLRELRALG